MGELGGLSVGPFGYDDIRWDGHTAEIQIVIFDDSFSQYALLESTAHWFDGCCHLKEIKGIENLKTNAVKDMGHMFQSCSSLGTIDISGLETQNVENYACMFDGCLNLTELNVGKFNTKRAKAMVGMFSRCSAIKSH